MDPNGAVIPGATITLIDETKQKITVLTTDNGEFRFGELSGSKFTLEIEVPGFRRLMMTEIVVKVGEEVRVESTLELSAGTEVVGGMMADPTPIYSNGTGTLSGDVLQKVPH